MTADTQVAPVRGNRRGPVLRTVRWLVRGQLVIAAWAVSVVLAGATVALIVWANLGEVTASVVQFSRQGGIWFPFAMAIGTITAYLPVHVAAGMTRRSLARAAVLAMLVMTVVYAVALTVLLQVERLVYGIAGWSHELTESDTSYASSDIDLVLGTHLALIGTAQLCGLLVGITYYRFGGWWGTLTLPLTVGPIFGVMWILQAGLGIAAPGLDLALRAAVIVGLLVVLAAAFSLATRGATVHTATG
ncbi:hypothetical protein [Actinotalea sp. K2]|uniref:hypothetical protein n=1 Tax=Actinotalea sp. K2 TaxID=2939438 RepID=UPI0020177CE8|nr:hypothetical protein [Actinotalea sp. K2]MCL3859576.1 hypothetical protein [Actinotalea sp. K2]